MKSVEHYIIKESKEYSVLIQIHDVFEKWYEDIYCNLVW
jgi:hypothetical protein